MRYSILAIGKMLFIVFALCTAHFAYSYNVIQPQSIILNGKNLTIGDVVKVAKQNSLVKIDNAALEKVKRSTSRKSKNE